MNPNRVICEWLGKCWHTGSKIIDFSDGKGAYYTCCEGDVPNSDYSTPEGMVELMGELLKKDLGVAYYEEEITSNNEEIFKYLCQIVDADAQQVFKDYGATLPLALRDATLKLIKEERK